MKHPSTHSQSIGPQSPLQTPTPLSSPQTPSLATRQTLRQAFKRVSVARRMFWGMVSVSILLHIGISMVPWPKPAASVLDLSNAENAEKAESEIFTEIALVEAPPALSANESAASSQLSDQSTQPQPEPPTITTQLPAAAVSSLAPIPEEPLWTNEAPPLDVETDAEDQDTAFEDDLEQYSDDNGPPNDEEDKSTLDQDVEDLEANGSVESGPVFEQGMVLQLADDFPHLPSSSSGCFGLDNCHQASGNYRNVVRELTRQMEEQGYQLIEQDDIEGTGRRVFEVRLPTEPDQLYYLNVFSDGLNSAVYAITRDVLSLDALKALQS